MSNQHNLFVLQKKRSLIETLGSLSLFERKLLNIALRQASSPLVAAIDSGSCDLPIRVKMQTSDILSLLSIDARSLPNLKSTARTLAAARLTFNVFVRDDCSIAQSDVMQQTSTLFTRIMIGSHECEFSINPDILPFISKDDLTALLDLRVQANFKSKYAQMIWELCSVAIRENHDEVLSEVFHVNSFRKYLNLDDSEYYKNNARLMNKIVKPACKEVTKVSNLDVQCLPQKQGRNITSLCFHIKVKKNIGVKQENIDFLSSSEGLLLKRLQYSENRIHEMVSLYGVEYISNKVNHLKSRIADTSKPPVKTPVGWLDNCIKKDWSNPYAGQDLLSSEKESQLESEHLKEALLDLQKQYIESCEDDLPLINKAEVEEQLGVFIKDLRVGGHTDFIEEHQNSLLASLSSLKSEYSSEFEYMKMLEKQDMNQEYISTRKIDRLICNIQIHTFLIKICTV